MLILVQRWTRIHRNLCRLEKAGDFSRKERYNSSSFPVSSKRKKKRLEYCTGGCDPQQASSSQAYVPLGGLRCLRPGTLGVVRGDSLWERPWFSAFSGCLAWRSHAWIGENLAPRGPSPAVSHTMHMSGLVMMYHDITIIMAIDAWISMRIHSTLWPPHRR